MGVYCPGKAKDDGVGLALNLPTRDGNSFVKIY